MKNGIKSLAVWLIFLIIFIVLISSIMDNSSNKLAYSERLADMENGTVTSIEIQDGGEKALVELDGKPFKYFEAHREEWAIETCYVYPGAIQYYGPAEVCDITTKTLALEQE